MIVGVLGAAGCQLQIYIFENYLFIDDPLNASAVHFGAGGVGMLYVAFMAKPEFAGEDFAGIFYGGDASFLGNQLLGMLVYTVWTLGLSGAMFYGLMSAGWFRVAEEEEDEGMDESHHGGKAYPADDTHVPFLEASTGSSEGEKPMIDEEDLEALEAEA